MDIQRTITVLLPTDTDLLATLESFQQVQQSISETAFNGGKPLNSVALHRAVYDGVKGSLSSQMTCTAIRAVAGAYQAAKSNRKPAKRPFAFTRRRAAFLIGQRGRDARFTKDGLLSIWTVSGRKRISYTIPDKQRHIFDAASDIDALNVIERGGKLIGRLTVTLTVPDPSGVLPVGIDLNETNAIVAVDADGNNLFISGKATKVANTRTRKTRQRVQSKHATRKAEGKDTRSVRRVLKRLGRKQSNRTKTFCQTAGKRLVEWAPENSVLVLEDLHVPKPGKQSRQRKGVRRRLHQWSHGQILDAITAKAEERGIAVTFVNPAYTSQDCSRCGLRGVRQKHRFVCPHCGHEAHADLNAAVNIRNRYTVLRDGGPSSTGPEAQPLTGVGKPLPSGMG